MTEVTVSFMSPLKIGDRHDPFIGPYFGSATLVDVAPGDRARWVADCRGLTNGAAATFSIDMAEGDPFEDSPNESWTHMATGRWSEPGRAARWRR